MGEDLDPICLKELQNLEQQIDTGLKRIRLRKVSLILQSSCHLNYSMGVLDFLILINDSINYLMQNQLIHESISELHKKVRSLCNNYLILI